MIKPTNSLNLHPDLLPALRFGMGSVHVHVLTTNGYILNQTIVLDDNVLGGRDVVVKRMYCSTDMTAPLYREAAGLPAEGMSAMEAPVPERSVDRALGFLV